MSSIAKKEIRWTPRLIRELRGERALADFASSIGASRNTVSGWEAGKVQPDETYSERLSELAEREHFLKDWKLAGSMRLLDDLENAKAEMDDLSRKSLERTARQLAE
jgi:DNA-binding XRE family transcriptional regulator